MSGIVGIFHRDGRPASPERMEAVVEHLARRGPDRQDMWAGPCVALGHALLRSTPEAEHEEQPLQSRDGPFVLTADARLDNRGELIRALDLRERPNAAIPDSALLLAAYEKWGTASPEKLVGDFAFAVWDAREQHLFCARDPVGVRPFNYHLSDRLFAFSSGVQALLQFGDVPRRLNERQILAFLTDLDDDRTATFYSSIQRLPSAHAMIVRRDGDVRRWRYWKPEETVQELRLDDDRAYEEGFREVFEEAVRSSLRSSTPVGIMLSGGMDSTAVACTARTVVGNETGPIHTYTGTFGSFSERERRKIDERAYVEDVVAQGGFEPHYMQADQISPLYGIERMVEMRGEPFKARSHYVILKMIEAARRDGLRVMLDGCEGDVVVGYGFDYFTELARAGDWQTFARMAGRYSQHCRNVGRRYPPERAFWNHGLEPLLAHMPAGRWKRFGKEATAVSNVLDVSRARLWKRGLRRLAPEALRRRWKRWRYQNGDARLVEAHVLRDAGLLNGKETQDAPRSPLVRRAQGLQQSTMLSEALEGIDGLYANHHVEARHPFYDRRVIEYCLALPPEQRFKGGWTRSIARRALRDVYPESLQTRVGKANLGINITRNLLEREQERLHDIVHDPLLRPYVSKKRAEQAYQRFTDDPTSVNARPLLRMTVLTAWLRKCVKERQ